MQKLNIPSSFISSEQYSSMVTPNAWAALSIVYPLPNRLSGFRLSLWDARSANGTTWNYLEQPEGLLERRIAVTRASVCDGNAMNVRWFWIAVQNYCKFLNNLRVKCTKSEKNAIKYEKNRSSCIFTIISRWYICQNSEARSDEALQTLQTLHIFESQARVRIYII